MLTALKILDFSSRLPGPLGTSLLAQLGAKVSKWERENERDAFFNSELAQRVPEFSSWYYSLNRAKQIKFFTEFDLSRPSWIKKNLAPAQLMLLPLSRQAWVAQLKKQWRKLDGPRALIEVGGSQQGLPLQDLIAQARTTGLLTQQKNALIPQPPYVPLGGILLGHALAIQLLAAWIKARENQKNLAAKKVFLEKVCKKNLHFLSAQPPHGFLHQGHYPCYNLYALKDKGVLALACLERAHYQQVMDEFDLPIAVDQRLQASAQLIKKMRAHFRALTINQIRKKLKANPELPGVALVF